MLWLNIYLCAVNYKNYEKIKTLCSTFAPCIVNVETLCKHKLLNFKFLSVCSREYVCSLDYISSSEFFSKKQNKINNMYNNEFIVLENVLWETKRLFIVLRCNKKLLSGSIMKNYLFSTVCKFYFDCVDSLEVFII